MRSALSLTSARLDLVSAQTEHAEAFADAAMESVIELSQWARRETHRLDRAHYIQQALARAAGTAAGTSTHRYGFIRSAPQQLVCSVTLRPWRNPRAALNPSHHLLVEGSPDLEVGCWCRTSLTGNGYASEAVSAVVEHAFADVGTQAIWVRVAELNVRSRRLAERLGFVEVDRIDFPSSPEWGEAATVLVMRRDATPSSAQTAQLT